MSSPNEEYKIFSVSHQKGVSNDLKFHTHFQYEVLILYNGDCRYAIGNNIFHIQPGDIVLMDGSLMHRAFINSDTRYYERSIVQFSKDWIAPVLKSLQAEKYLEKFEKNHYTILRSKDEQQLQEIEKHIKVMESYVRDSSIKENEIQIKLALINLLLSLDKVSSVVNPDDKKEVGEKHILIQEVVRYVQNNFHNSFTLDEVAADLNVSKSHLVHLFKDLTGNTVMEYAMSYRLKQAMHMVAAFPDLKNLEICYRCGFKNESHFSRYFKKHVGVTPSEFRKSTLI